MDSLLIAMHLMLMVLQGWSKPETPYHYISQVPETTPPTLTPRPLFSPHDPRREGSGRIDYEQKKHIASNLKPLFSDSGSNVDGDQAILYPIYSNAQYPGWVSVEQTPLIVSYGPLPEGYAPTVPLRGDPLGYSFSYQTDDHTRHEVSDGRGNFFSSFSFIPQDGSNDGSFYGSSVLDSWNPSAFTTSRPSTVNIPTRRPAQVPLSQTFRPSTSKPLFSPTETAQNRPTAKPFVKSQPGSFNDDFSNGYYFESKKLPTTRLPPTSVALSHALSTNIQYNRNSGESTQKPGGVRAVTILSSDSPKVTTDRSYQALSRSLPLALSKTSTASPIISSSHPPYYPPSYKGFASEGFRKDDTLSLRSASRRSTTESLPERSLQRSTQSSQSSTKKPSVIQKIPRKKTNDEDLELRPVFIDDLTSLAYSTDSNHTMNNSIIQIKPRKEKKLTANFESGVKQVLLVGNNEGELSLASVDIISKDGYMSGNKTHLGGIGLRPNIHY